MDEGGTCLSLLSLLVSLIKLCAHQLVFFIIIHDGPAAPGHGFQVPVDSVMLPLAGEHGKAGILNSMFHYSIVHSGVWRQDCHVDLTRDYVPFSRVVRRDDNGEPHIVAHGVSFREISPETTKILHNMYAQKRRQADHQKLVEFKFRQQQADLLAANQMPPPQVEPSGHSGQAVVQGALQRNAHSAAVMPVEAMVAISRGEVEGYNRMMRCYLTMREENNALLEQGRISAIDHASVNSHVAELEERSATIAARRVTEGSKANGPVAHQHYNPPLLCQANVPDAIDRLIRQNAQTLRRPLPPPTYRAHVDPVVTAPTTITGPAEAGPKTNSALDNPYNLPRANCWKLYEANPVEYSGPPVPPDQTAGTGGKAKKWCHGPCGANKKVKAIYTAIVQQQQEPQQYFLATRKMKLDEEQAKRYQAGPATTTTTTTSAPPRSNTTTTTVVPPLGTQLSHPAAPSAVTGLNRAPNTDGFRPNLNPVSGGMGGAARDMKSRKGKGGCVARSATEAPQPDSGTAAGDPNRGWSDQPVGRGRGRGGRRDVPQPRK